MNSYPPELLAQLAPVMFVAGLDVPQQTDEKTQDPFTQLKSRLRESLLAQRKVAVWQPEKSRIFQAVLVDREVNFPPRKLPPPDDAPQYAVGHSPLSPLTPSSPLHPDGLIAPIWIRKHTTLVPSVFVLFMHLFEYPPHNPKSPLDAPDPNRDHDKEQEERKRDSELAMEVALRKKSTNERSIKLTVVLIASRTMLDDPSLDSRLTFIRRQSGLDSRAALFVLSPVSMAELTEFVQSLQQALYDPALDYYTSHSKRVRRKRNRHSQAATVYPTPVAPLASPNTPRPLRPEGWTVRYEYKMACFAEFRGEDEVALKHYQDAYSTLVIMFGSTLMLPPRTKRWAEAKVLADCINIKVTKLYLYNNEPALALSHHNSHVRQFGDFSRGWGIGEETFEFWSWIARQHRILAELLEQGSRTHLKLPSHMPPPLPSSSAAASSSAFRGLPIGTLEMEAARSIGINPSHALQHPGFYYYMAAQCTEQRRARYMAACEAESRGELKANSPGFANEKKVDHVAIILELYTKAYDLFKKYAGKSEQSHAGSRMPLWVALRIAQTHFDAGKFDSAVKFFERIAKSYRKEQWGSLLQPLLSTWYACAQQLGDCDLSVKLLIEKIGQGSADPDDPSSLEEDLLAVLKSTVPSSPDSVLTIDPEDSLPIFNTNAAFWSPEVDVGDLGTFQLSIEAPSGISISSLPFTSLTIHFSEPFPPVVLKHNDSAGSGKIRTLKLGDVAKLEEDNRNFEVDLRWTPGSTLVVCGNVSSVVPRTFSISKLVFVLEQSRWKIEMPMDPCTQRPGSIPNPRWLRSIESPRFLPITTEWTSVSFRHRPHTVSLSVSHDSPAYVDEDYPISIHIENKDDLELYVTLNILLQPTDIDHAINTITLDDETSTGLIRGIFLGVVPAGGTVTKKLTMHNTGGAGDRMLDISAQSRTSPPPEPHSPATADGAEVEEENIDTTETLQTVTIPVVAPLVASHSVSYRRASTKLSELADLRLYDGNYWSEVDGSEAAITTNWKCEGPWGLDVQSLKLIGEKHPRAILLDSALDEDDFPSEYQQGDEFCDICRVCLAPLEDTETEPYSVPGPGHFSITWRRVLQDGEKGPLSTTTFRLPTLEPLVDALIALLLPPTVARLHIPVPLQIIVRNRHPTRSANIVVQLETDMQDGFIVSGIRQGRIPILMPGAQETLTWQLIPMDCGYIRLPKIKVLDKRKPRPQGDAQRDGEGELVRIVHAQEDLQPQSSERKSGEFARDSYVATVLVLPP